MTVQYLRLEWTGILWGSCKNTDSEPAGLGWGLRSSQGMLLLTARTRLTTGKAKCKMEMQGKLFPFFSSPSFHLSGRFLICFLALPRARGSKPRAAAVPGQHKGAGGENPPREPGRQQKGGSSVSQGPTSLAQMMSLRTYKTKI